MCTNWKRFTFKAIMLASLSLFLFACAADTPADAPALREVRGVVADSSTGQAFSNAVVAVYSIDASGRVSTTPLSTPTSVRSDGQGNFVLNIPQSYIGALLVKATENGSTILRSALSSVPQNQSVAISLATEMAVQYVVVNKASIFTLGNIQQSILVQEPFFGQNFAQITPSAVGASPTDSQQQLLVMTQSVRSLLSSGNTIATLVKVNSNTHVMAMGEGALFVQLNSAVTTVSAGLINSGAISGAYVPPVITPIPEPPITDTVPPTAPQNLKAIPSSNAVVLVWDASSDAVGVVSYYVYRNGQFINSVAAPKLTYTDNTVASGTKYTFEVKARDAAGNLSIGSSVDVTTPQIITYSVSGRITRNGAGLASVSIAVSGSGSGVFFTDVNGNFLIPGVRQGSYTITPTSSNYTFTPVSRSFTVSGSNVTGQDFSAEAVAMGTVTGGVTYPPGTIVGGISYPSGVVIGGVTYPSATVIGGVVYPTGTVVGGVTYPNGVVIGGVTYPPGTIVGGVAFPVGAVTSGINYPSGTIIGGISSPSGVVIGGVTYPTATVVGGVEYPTGTVIGGVTYPNGVVIGGVSYPSGTIVGGVAFPVGTVTSGFNYPNGTVVGGIIYPTGTVTGNAAYPAGTIVGGISYPSGVVVGGVTYQTATVIGGVVYPTGTVIGGTTYPNGIVIGGVSYPPGTIVGGVAFPVGAVTTGITYPNGTVVGGVIYPTGTVTGGMSYPAGTIVGGISYPPGSVIGGIAYPTGVTVVSGVAYPTGTVTGGTTYPNGVVIGGVSYPAGTVVGGVAYPVGAVTAGIAYPSGAVVGSVLYPNGVIVGTMNYPSSTMGGSISYPEGSLISSLTWNQLNRISGVVTYNGTGLSGVTVLFTKDGQDYTVASTGIFGEFSVSVPLGTYTITPLLTGYSFSPAEIPSITINTEGTVIEGQNFAAAIP